MANVQHSSLTDPELHEPKDISTASSGEVYVADGSASGTWDLAEAIQATKSFAGNDSTGYIKLPGGLIIQWKRGSQARNTTVTFPIAFPNACFSVVGVDANGAAVFGASNLSTTGFILRSSVSILAYRCIAIGY